MQPARRDPVELILHGSGEVVVHQPREIAFQQSDHRECHPRRHQRGAAPPHVPTVGDGADDRRVGRRPADAHLLERLDQARLGIPRGRLGRVPVGGRAVDAERLALGQRRQLRRCSRPRGPGLPGTRAAGHVVISAATPSRTASRRPSGTGGTGGRLGIGVVRRVVVGPLVAGEGDRLAGRGEHQLADRPGCPSGRNVHRDAGRHGAAPRIGHLRGDGALPDQLVEPELVAGQLARHLPGRAELVAGGPDRLVRLLGVLHLAGVVPRRVRDVLGPVQFAGLGARGI